MAGVSVRWSHLLAVFLLSAWLPRASSAQSVAQPPAPAQPIAKTAAEVQACVEARLPAQASKQTIALAVSDSEGEFNRARARIYWKRFEGGLAAVQLRFSEPPRRAGMAMLAREQSEGDPDTYLYLPELRQTRRVPASSAAGSMFGTDFSYEDFAFLQGVRRASTTRKLADAELEGRPVYVLETRPEGEGSGYDRIVVYVEVERCVPLQADFYASGEKLRKQFRVDRDAIESFGELRIPMHYTMEDLEAGTATDVRVEKIDPEATLRDKLFQPLQLEQGGR